MHSRSELPVYYERKSFSDDFPVLALNYTQQYQANASLHHHDCLEIGRCIKGTGLLFADGRVHFFKADSLYVIPEGCVHDSGIMMNSPHEEPSIWQYLFINTAKLGITVDCFAMLNPSLLPLFDWLFTLAEQKPLRWEEETKHLLQVLAIEVNRAGTAHSPFSTDAMLVIQHKIATEYGSDLTVEKLACECNLSVSAFRKRFTSFTGMCPQQYIIQTRLQVAQHLICNTSDKMIVIAQKAGFRTLSSFNRLFLRHYGYPPGKLRGKRKIL